MAVVRSVNVGSVGSLTAGRRTVPTAIFKRPVTGPLRLGTRGLLGDEQADLRHHGGPDKAVNVYPLAHLAYWSERLDLPLSPGAFGENLTVAGLDEQSVQIGDVYRIGSARVQVTQARQPCFKLSAKLGQPQLVRWVEESGKTGFYLRCLEEGDLAAGDAITLEQRPADSLSVADAYAALRDGQDQQLLKRLLAIAALSDAWRSAVQQQLAALGSRAAGVAGAHRAAVAPESQTQSE